MNSSTIKIGSIAMARPTAIEYLEMLAESFRRNQKNGSRYYADMRERIERGYRELKLALPDLGKKYYFVKQQQQLVKQPVVQTHRDHTKYNFDGKTYNKGRLCLAIVRKYVDEQKPTFETFKQTFAPEVIKPLGKFFLPAEEARTRNADSKRRFFDEENDTFVVEGNSIALSNQIDQGIVDRMLVVAKKFNYTIQPQS